MTKTERRHAHIANVSEVGESTISHGAHYELRRKQLGAAAQGKKIGTSLVELPPGKRAWPLHYHAANEEALFVLSGRGTLRLGKERIAIAEGDYVAFPVGPDHAHQLINDSDAPLRYLCISTMIEPDVFFYPDSNKVGFFAGSAPGGDRSVRYAEGILPMDARVDYWDGEDDPK